jgi:hypothetical protein
MWRAFFLAIGISLAILGAECFVIEQAVMTKRSPDEPAVGMPTQSVTIRPPEWAPWSLVSAGVIIVLYSFTLTKRAG